MIDFKIHYNKETPEFKEFIEHNNISGKELSDTPFTFSVKCGDALKIHPKCIIIDALKEIYGDRLVQKSFPPTLESYESGGDGMMGVKEVNAVYELMPGKVFGETPSGANQMKMLLQAICRNCAGHNK